MKKRKLGILIVIIGLVVTISIIFGTKKQENDIEHMLKTVIRIQYGWGNIEELNQLCTDEFLETVDSDEICLGRKIYSIEKGYMDNVQEISGNEIEISVNVYSPDITIHKFTLMRTEDNQYLINGIEHDI